MSELEQRLTNELGKLAEQYGQDQKRLAGQVDAFARAGATVGRAVRELGRTCATVDRAIRTGATRAHPVGEFYHRARQEIGRQLQDTDGRFKRTHSMIHAEAERKRNAGDRWDRVEGRIESLIQSQRERNRSGPDLG